MSSSRGPVDGTEELMKRRIGKLGTLLCGEDTCKSYFILLSYQRPVRDAGNLTSCTSVANTKLLDNSLRYRLELAELASMASPGDPKKDEGPWTDEVRDKFETYAPTAPLATESRNGADHLHLLLQKTEECSYGSLCRGRKKEHSMPEQKRRQQGHVPGLLRVCYSVPAG